MNKSLSRLFHIASLKERKIIGLMSGTSMDGLDIALCLCKGSGIKTEIKLLQFETISYSDEFRLAIKDVFAKRKVDLQKVCLLNEVIGIKHAELILSTLKKWHIKPEEVHLIASHGQTIFHAPKRLHNLRNYPNSTLQIGDGDHIAVNTGIITLCDFRQKHIASGGEGAPLAVYGDYILFSEPTESRILLNIGGISNLTYLPANGDPHHVFSTDIGPGNTLMDQYIQHNYPNLYFDKDGAIAKSGSTNELLLNALLDHPFFRLPLHKTTGPELFNLSYIKNAQQQSSTNHLKEADVLATLCSFSAQIVIQTLESNFKNTPNLGIYMSGGGAHHPLLVSQIKNALPLLDFKTTEALGINPDAKEAVLFAVLANECIAADEQIDFGPANGVPSIAMGKICMPSHKASQ